MGTGKDAALDDQLCRDLMLFLLLGSHGRTIDHERIGYQAIQAKLSIHTTQPRLDPLEYLSLDRYHATANSSGLSSWIHLGHL